MNQPDNEKSESNGDFRKLPSIKNGNFLHSNNLNNIIKNLSNPRFLGSIHLKKDANINKNSLDNLIENELDLKITKSLKNTLFNPITKILILSAIVFNLFWFLSLYFF